MLEQNNKLDYSNLNATKIGTINVTTNIDTWVKVELQSEYIKEVILYMYYTLDE